MSAVVDELDCLEYIDLTDFDEEDVYVYHHRGILLQSDSGSDANDEEDIQAILSQHNKDDRDDRDDRDDNDDNDEKDPHEEIFEQFVDLFSREHSLDEFIQCFDDFTVTHNIAIDIDRISPKIGTTLFFHALRCNRLDIARFLVEMGADVMYSRPSSPSMYMDVVLHYVVDEETETHSHTHTHTHTQTDTQTEAHTQKADTQSRTETDSMSHTLSMFKLLIEGCRFDVNACVSPEEGAAKSLLGAVLEQFSGEEKVVRFLLRHGADVNYKYCNFSRLVSIAGIAMDWSLSPAVIYSIYHHLGESAQAAMMRKVYELNQYLLVVYDSKNENIFLPMARARFLMRLFIASSHNHRECFDAKIYCQSLESTEFHCSQAAHDFQQDMLQLVVDSAPHLFHNCMIPLISRVDTFLSLHSLAERFVFDINTRDAYGCTALHNIVSRSDDYLLLSLLLNVLGADPNTVDYERTTPLITACMLGHHNAVQLLLHSGARVDVWNTNKQNALFLCIQAEDADLVRMIVNEFSPAIILGLRDPVTGRTALEEANLCGEIAVVNILSAIFQSRQAL